MKTLKDVNHKLGIFGLQMQPNWILRNNFQKIKKISKKFFQIHFRQENRYKVCTVIEW